MYLQFFSLRQAPFSIAPDPHALFMSQSHREALAHLLFGVGSGGGFVMLSGEIGAGKTTICRCLLEQVPEKCRVAYVFNPKLSVNELLRSICDEFGIGATNAASIKDYVDQINLFLLDGYAKGCSTVLIIDEAQNLSAEVLEQLRLLTNLETHTRKLLQIILIGQPELREMIAQPRLEQLAQRMIARYHLGPLTLDETASYVRHRLLAAGGNGHELFDDVALRLVHRISRGIPRRINLLCDRAMLGAYALNQRQIDQRIVARAAEELFPEARKSNHYGWLALAGLSLLGLGAVLATILPTLLPKLGPQPKTAFAVNAPAAPVQTLVPALASALVPSADPAGLIASLPSSPDAGLRRLMALWGAKQGKEGDPCTDSAATGLFCYRGSGGLAELRTLDRPALIELTDGQGLHYAELASVGTNSFALRIGDATHVFSALTMATYFQGSFVTIWRAPPGFSNVINPTERSLTIDWIANRLDLPGNGASGQAFGTVFTRAVRDFQLSQGLKADGLVGPRTLMVLNRASGVDEPRLPRISIAEGK